MENLTCDMHIHTLNSDGKLSTIELLEYCIEKNLHNLSITDHDCIDAYKDLEQILQDDTISFKGEIICGVELVCKDKDYQIEVLSYGYDRNKMQKYLSDNAITQEMIDQFHFYDLLKSLRKFNFIFSYQYENFPAKDKKSKFASLFNALVSNSQIRKLIDTEEKLVGCLSGDFMRFGLYNPWSKFYVGSILQLPNVKEVCKAVKECGGLCFLAHPYQYPDPIGILEDIKDYIDGVEGYHFTCQDLDKQIILRNWANANGKMISGGSDFHRKIDPANKKNKLNEIGVPLKVFEDIKERLQKENKLKLNENYFIFK